MRHNGIRIRFYSLGRVILPGIMIFSAKEMTHAAGGVTPTHVSTSMHAQWQPEPWCRCAPAALLERVQPHHAGAPPLLAPTHPRVWLFHVRMRASSWCAEARACGAESAVTRRRRCAVARGR